MIMSAKLTGLCVPYRIGVRPGRGRGVFAKEAIRKGTVVWRHVRGQYSVYEERALRQLLTRLSHGEAVYELTHMFGLPEFPGYMIRVLDEGVLINHSREPTTVLNTDSGEYEAPCVTSTQQVMDALLNDRFALIATRDLKAGEELTQDYNTDIEDPSYYDALCQQYGISWSWL